MPILIPRRKWARQQPLGQQQADPAHSLYSSLVEGWVLNQVGTRGIKTGYFNPATPSATPTFVSSAQGVGFRGTNLYPLVDENVLPLPITAATVVIGVYYDPGASAPDGALFGHAGNVGSQRLWAHMPYSDGTTYWDFGTPGGRLTWSPSVTEYYGWHVYAFVAGAAMQIWVDGVQKASGGASPTRVRDLTTSWGLQAYAAPAMQTVPFIYVFDRSLGPAEIAEVSAAPYRLLRRNPSRFYLLPAAGGNVTVALTGQAATASAGSVTSSRTRAIAGEAATAAAGTASALVEAARLTWAQISVPAPTADVTVALTGQSVTASGGSVTPSAAKALSGQAATSAAGTVAPSAVKALSGSAGTASAGTVAPSTAKALTGSAATASAGTVTTGSDVTAALTGQAATAAAGTLTPSRTVPLSGQAATASAGTMTTGSDVVAALTGQSATASAGSVGVSTTKALTGDVATASAGTVAPDRSKALTGQAATGTAGTVTPSRTVPLSGEQATTATGTLTAPGNVTVALSGIGATASAGTLGLSLTIVVSGAAATGAAGSVTRALSVALAGSSATAAAGTMTSSGGVSATPLDEPRFRQRVRVASKRINGKAVPGSGRIGDSIP